MSLARAAGNFLLGQYPHLRCGALELRLFRLDSSLSARKVDSLEPFLGTWKRFSLFFVRVTDALISNVCYKAFPKTLSFRVESPTPTNQ